MRLGNYFKFLVDLVIYKGNDLKRQARWMSTMPYKEDRDRAILHDLHAYPQPVFDGEIIRYAKNNNHLDTFVEKISLWRNFHLQRS